MSLDDFRALNPQFGPYVIAGGNEVKILLPKENAEKFRKNLSLWTRPLSSWTAYQVTSPREKVEDIAARLNISPDVIRQANNIPSRSVLKFGSAILVPKTAGYDRDIAPELVENAKLAWERDLPATRLVTVPVRKPARLASIAKRYRVSVAELKSWNKINGDTVKKGTILKVHVPYRSAAATTRARTKAIRAADVRTSRNTRASRVKVVMDAKNTASTKKGLVKSKNSRTARATLSKKTKSVKNQVSAQQTKTRKTAAKNRKKA